MRFPRTSVSLIAPILTLGLLSAAGAAERIQAVASADGRLEIFVQSHSGGNIYHAWQTRAAAGANPAGWHWETADINLSGDDFVAGRDSAGRLFVAAIQNGTIHINAQPYSGSSFGDPWSLDTHDLHGLSLASNADGRIEFFALSGLGIAWSTAETQAGNRTFANHYLGGTKLLSIVPTPFKDGRLALVGVGGDRSVWWTSQVAPNAGWNNWSSLGGHDIQIVAAGANADGRLDIVALGADKGLYHRYELPGGGFSAWETLAVGRFTEPLSLVSNADGRLEVFLHDDMSRIVHAWQFSPNGVWSNFAVLDNIIPNTRANSLTRMPDGRLVIAAIDNGDQYPEINIAGQIRANGEWEAWMRPPTAAPPPPAIFLSASPDDGYACLGTPQTLTWTASNCGASCDVTVSGKGSGYASEFVLNLPHAPVPSSYSTTPADQIDFTVTVVGGQPKTAQFTIVPPQYCSGQTAPKLSTYWFAVKASSLLVPQCTWIALPSDSKGDAISQVTSTYGPTYTVTPITEDDYNNQRQCP